MLQFSTLKLTEPEAETWKQIEESINQQLPPQCSLIQKSAALSCAWFDFLQNKWGFSVDVPFPRLNPLDYAYSVREFGPDLYTNFTEQFYYGKKPKEIFEADQMQIQPETELQQNEPQSEKSKKNSEKVSDVTNYPSDIIPIENYFGKQMSHQSSPKSKGKQSSPSKKTVTKNRRSSGHTKKQEEEIKPPDTSVNQEKPVSRPKKRRRPLVAISTLSNYNLFLKYKLSKEDPNENGTVPPKERLLQIASEWRNLSPSEKKRISESIRSKYQYI